MTALRYDGGGLSQLWERVELESERADMTLSHKRKRGEEARGKTEEPGASARRPKEGRVKRPGTQTGWII